MMNKQTDYEFGFTRAILGIALIAIAIYWCGYHFWQGSFGTALAVFIAAGLGAGLIAS